MKRLLKQTLRKWTTGPFKVSDTTNRHVVARCLLLGFLSIGIAACSNAPDEDLRNYVKQVKAKKKGRIPPLPEPQTFEIYTYDENSLRDPFIPMQVLEAAENAKSRANSGPRPEAGRQKEILEEFALGSLKLMGSLERDGKRWALLKAPDGTLHRTTAGHYMGQNNGKILKISETQLELKELVPDGLGGWVERFSTLTVNE